MAGVILEYLLRGHILYHRGDSRVHQVDNLASPDEVHQRDYHKPYQQASAADYEGIFQTYYISQTEDGRAGIDLQDDLRLVGYRLADSQDSGAYGVRPGPERADHEIVQASHQAAHEQSTDTLAAFSADQDLRGSRRLRERILPVHLLDEVLPERNQEQDAQDASQQGRQEHLHETYFHSEDVDGRKGEYRSGDNRPGAASDGLDDHVLPQSFLLPQGTGEPHGYDRYRDCSFEDLSDPQSQVGRRGGKQDHHQDTHYH